MEQTWEEYKKGLDEKRAKDQKASEATRDFELLQEETLTTTVQ